MALHFYGTGGYQKSVKNVTQLSQSSVSKAIKEVSDLLYQKMVKYVRFPISEQERRTSELSFRTEGLPGVIGIIDGTQIAIAGVKKSIEHAYVCRKGFHSINTQLICDHENKFINVNSRYPGSTHDSYIWGTSGILGMFETEYISPERQRYWILGDSGYPLQPWLLTAHLRPANESEERFNRIIKQMRSRVERAIGILKNRFRCVLGERKLRYDPTTTGKIICAVVVIHNFLILNKFTDEFSTQITIPETAHHNFNVVNRNNQYLNAGKLIRSRIEQQLA